MDLASIGWVFAFMAMISVMSMIVVASSTHYRDRSLHSPQRAKPQAGSPWIGRQR